MIKRILVADPKDRISMQAIKQHRWFTKGLPPGALEMNEFLLQGLSTMDDVRPCFLLSVLSLNASTRLCNHLSLNLQAYSC